VTEELEPTELSWPERLLVARAVLLLPLCSLAVHRLGFWRSFLWLRRLAGPELPRALPDEAQLARARRLAGLVLLANERFSPLRASCLPRSMVLWYQLRRGGIPAELRLGARTVTGRFEAHAWVEVAGRPLAEAADVARVFEPFDLTAALPGGSRP
jgi:hypothetical protein